MTIKDAKWLWNRLSKEKQSTILTHYGFSPDFTLTAKEKKIYLEAYAIDLLMEFAQIKWEQVTP